MYFFTNSPGLATLPFKLLIKLSSTGYIIAVEVTGSPVYVLTGPSKLACMLKYPSLDIPQIMKALHGVSDFRNRT